MRFAELFRGCIYFLYYNRNTKCFCIFLVLSLCYKVKNLSNKVKTIWDSFYRKILDV